MLFVVPLALLACKKEEPQPLPIPVCLELEHVVGDQPLEFDTIRYHNEAGNEFSVTRMLYYLSGITLIHEDGKRYTASGAYLVDARDERTTTHCIENIPQGNYTGMEFSIGVVPELNTFGSLPNTVANNAMFWPEQMGGGYHFLKLEGHFVDDQAQVAGYAMHLGTNETLVHITLDRNFGIGLDNIRLTLRMNIMEWFQHPETYDLKTGNYSMGDAALMNLISKNGKDVFTFP